MGEDQLLPARLKIWLGKGFGTFVALGCVFLLASVLFFDKVCPFEERKQIEIAQAVAKIDKLPPGFERRVTGRIGKMLFVEYRNEPTTWEIKLSRLEGSPSDVPADKLLAESTKAFTNAPIEKKVVGNEDLYYRIQEQKMTSSAKMQGCVVAKASKDVIRIESVYLGEHFKMDEMDKFLGAITGF
jgi:hypothetical protein